MNYPTVRPPSCPDCSHGMVYVLDDMTTQGGPPDHTWYCKQCRRCLATVNMKFDTLPSLNELSSNEILQFAINKVEAEINKLGLQGKMRVNVKDTTKHHFQDGYQTIMIDHIGYSDSEATKEQRDERYHLIGRYKEIEDALSMYKLVGLEVLLIPYFVESDWEVDGEDNN